MRFFNLAWLAICATIFLVACGDDGTSAQSETMTDPRDGQVYNVVTIGSQTWMAENLNYITNSSYCLYDAESKCSKYGRLYTWDAALNVCPSGWHLPSVDEWKTLFYAVGEQPSSQTLNFGSSLGKVLKSKSDWNDGIGTDAFGFSALPAGYRRVDGDYYEEGDFTCFWSSDKFMDNGTNAFLYDQYSIRYDRTDSDKDAGLGPLMNKSQGCSVRCLKDETPEEKVKSSSSVTPISSSSVAISSSSVAMSSSSFYQLSSNVEYGELADSRDGQTYKTVMIGTQTWMAQNLNFKTDSSFCYNDEESNCTKYGRLYTWAAAVDKLESECGYGHACSLPSGNIQGVCPSGWHLPSKAEWETLFNAVGGQSTADGYSMAGKELKAISGWNNAEWNNGGNGNGTDDFGFSALPAGYRDVNWHYCEWYFASFWSSTEYDSGNAYSLDLYDNDLAYLHDNYKVLGNSVRCLKD